MDRSLMATERSEYERWLTSSTLSTHNDDDEKLIAFKLAKRLGIPPTTAIHASRGQKRKGSPLPEEPMVCQAVESDADIEFWMDGRVRRLRFSPAKPKRRFFTRSS